ncbi:putative dual-specificity RNA methyltransferase RlmN [Planctomycetes bacterium Pan216]|uniref:Probable dual-specificity RNA methyltransferase RlmN n=1 Tax=Kolteria novifilia TaxID=2527975 RepID=A0A518BC52_9BACT|nr:putative dual-specificity RNA methyltransferase RlmN [Planctomycetes bacterium Pan216]
MKSWCEEHGERGFRARQIREWAGQHRVRGFDAMTNLPKRLRHELDQAWTLSSSSVSHASNDVDLTRKLLVRLADGGVIECVLIVEEDRRTLCLSTQVGCAMGCVFCASGLDGVDRSLTTGEMIEQMLHVTHLLPPNERLTHIVVMGMGEPLANLEALLPALEFATAKTGLGVSQRHVTISTVGLPKRIRQLAEAGKRYHLAVSLHASNDRIRQQIVPTAEKVTLDEILAAADAFRQETGRQVTFEYVLLADINDEAHHAQELARRLRGRDAMINLIPFNPVSGLPYREPTSTRTKAFAETLREAGFTVKVRKRKGARIDAACGQLRRSQRDSNEIVPLVSS